MIKEFTGWVARILGIYAEPAFTRKPWSAFSDLSAGDYQRAVAPAELVNLAEYRREERMKASSGVDPLRICAAYAQDSLIHTPEGKIAEAASVAAYNTLPMEMRVNKFKQAYKGGSPILLHQHLADVLIDAAIDLHQHQGWTTQVYDGLRTMEGAYLLYHHAKPEWLAGGLLSTPGKSAHNRALAVDSMMIGADGVEVPMGGHFDHLDMQTNHRNYSGPGVTPQEQENRLLREQAFMRAALRRSTVIAPLREEFWDDRVPGSERDLWRVMESVCRCTRQRPPEMRAEDYPTFARQWENYLDKSKLQSTFGDYALHTPPPQNIVYHEKLKPIYDHELPAALRQALMDPALGTVS